MPLPRNGPGGTHLRRSRAAPLAVDCRVGLGRRPLREACFEELFVHFGQPSSWSCFADVEPALAALSQAGYRLAVSSNFDAR